MQTNKKIRIPRTEFPTARTGLGSQIRTDKDNSLPSHFGFVLDEALQLIEAPTVKPSVQPLSHKPVPTFPNPFQIFHYDCVSTTYDLFADVVVDPSHVAFLSATQSFKLSSGRLCAFTLESSPQILELHNFGLMTFENPAITTDSKVVYSEVNSEFLVATRSAGIFNRCSIAGVPSDLSRESDMKEHPTSSIIFDEFKGLVSPIEILPITFRNADGKILPFTFNKCGKANLIKRECEQIPVKTDGTRFYDGFLFEFGGFKVFRSLCDSFTGEVSRKPSPQILVNKMMKLESVACLGFKSSVNSVLNSLKKSARHIKQFFILTDFNFYRGNEFHNQIMLLRYLSLSGVKASIPHPQ